MTDTIQALVVTASVDDADVVSDILWGLGVRAIEERTGVGEGVGETVELWTAVGQDAASVERAHAALGGRWPCRLVEVPTAGAQSWRAFAAPVWIDDRLVIVPDWQHVDDAGGDAGDGPIVVRIEPGGAFGLGDHPTTQASLRALTQLGVAGADVLDVGCGTGVLAVVAALLDARSVRAVDVADAAVDATVDNARRNGVRATITVDTESIADIEDDYDVVVANILAPTLVAMADDLRRVTRHGGSLVISGVLADAHDHVLAALAPMQVERTDVIDGWACVILRH
jgi:ribosomal protein L11 methyltransferase